MSSLWCCLLLPAGPEPSDKCPLAIVSSYLGDIEKTRMVTWSLLTSCSVCLVTFPLAQHLLNNQQMVQKMRRPAPKLALRAGLACDCQRDRAAYSKGTRGKISIRDTVFQMTLPYLTFASCRSHPFLLNYKTCVS